MKFYRSDIIKMGGTALATSFAFIAYIAYLGSSATFSLSGSERISCDDAKTLQNEYLGFYNLPRVRYEDPRGSGNFHTNNLQGFRFKVDDINEIINNNKVLDGMGNPVRPDEIIFYLGKAGVFSEGFRIRPNLHIIAAGIKAGVLLIPTSPAEQGDKMKSSVFDKADPCPGPGCPRNFQ